MKTTLDRLIASAFSEKELNWLMQHQHFATNLEAMRDQNCDLESLESLCHLGQALLLESSPTGALEYGRAHSTVKS